jgi:GNAT superfamily N-acetyltransferase
MNQQSVSISRVGESGISHALLCDLDDIFFSASGTQSFASEAAKAAFRERWFGSYLSLNKGETFIAVSADGRGVGYLVGALDDPAQDPRHAELGYFKSFAAWTARYPAHLHINIATQYRSSGIGARLVDAFVGHARSRCIPGVHVVTGEGMRNVGFYSRLGFAPLAKAPWNGRTVVMLGRHIL